MQLTSGEMWIQFNDGSQLVVGAGASCIMYTSPEGRVTRWDATRLLLQFWLSLFFVFLMGVSVGVVSSPRYKGNEKMPEHVKEKLQCLSATLGLLENPSAARLRTH